jgi:hypothetical protein
MIIQLSTDVIFKDISVTPELSFFKKVLERCFDFFRAEVYPGMTTLPYQWEERIDHVDTGVYLEAGRTINLTNDWKIDCDFVLRYPIFDAGYVYTHEITIEHPADHIYFKLTFKHGDEVTTQFWAEVNMPPELESRFIPFMEEK